jgi:hypothetical protein
MSTILSKLSDELRAEGIAYQKKLNNLAMVKRVLPSEILQFENDVYVTIYSSWISLSFKPPENIKEDVEKYHWAKQMQLYLDTLFAIKWDSKPQCSDYTGGMWFSGRANCNSWEIWLSVITPKPPTCKITKVEVRETKEVVTVHYEAECPPDLSEELASVNK